jgi:hypothetical protein
MIHFHFPADIDAAVFEVAGEFSVADYLDAMDRFMRSEGFYPGINSIWDVRQAVTDAITGEDLQVIAEHIKKIASKRGPKWKVAIVVGSDLNYGLSRMFQAYTGSSPGEAQVFRSIEEAEAWISPQ